MPSASDDNWFSKHPYAQFILTLAMGGGMYALIYRAYRFEFYGEGRPPERPPLKPDDWWRLKLGLSFFAIMTTLILVGNFVTLSKRLRRGRD